MDNELVEKSYSEIHALCNGKKWQMSIPVNKNDSDCVIIAGITSLQKRIAELEAQVKMFQEARYSPEPPEGE